MFNNHIISSSVLIGCLTLFSHYAFAVNKPENNSLKIDKALLIGQWQCTEAMEYMGYDAKTQMTVEFKADGQYMENSKLEFENKDEKANFIAKTKAQWNTDKDKLTIDHYQLMHFEADNSSVESKLNLKAALSDPDAVEMKIKKLTKNEMLANLILFDEEIEHISRICTR
ncbi:hypothetical protein [Acinetobacter stercoris]|uniref:Lipocalin-like domain-containing protein n=1 Tax=Acinetobacter stercoris TaxID=2126983 RepID=A0A2U3N4D7_9GAMM|nr:hypothetical protein [Acinetobacter stercoris]SPL72522.1 hypothetical protein KPC_3700 [Acinetobacter stercoris]